MPVKARAGGQGRVRTGRPGAQIGSGGSPAAPAATDWFVDSVAGSNANNGTTSATPFQTLAALATAITANPTKTTVSLKRGSQFRESLPGAVTVCIDYGTGNLPIIDGSDIVTTWTVNGTQSAVWEKTLTIDTGGRPRIYEDGVLMPWVADLATCAATAGSRVLLNTGGTITLQMHPTGGGNPNSNGKTYEATARVNPVLMGDNCILKGIHARRAVGNDGAISMARNAYMERCVSSDGSKHNILIGSGSLVDVIAVRADAVTPTESSNVFIVGFDSRGIAGQSISFTRVGIMQDGQGNSVAFFTHDEVNGSYNSITAEQIWMDGFGGFSPATVTLSIQGYFAGQCGIPLGGWFANQTTVDCFQIRNTGFGSDNGIGNLTVTGAPNTILLKEGTIYSEGSNNSTFREQSVMNGGSLTVRNVAVANLLTMSRTAITDEGWTSGSLILNGNIFHSSPYGTYVVVPSGINYSGDHNAFAKRDDDGSGPGNEALIWHGTTYNGLVGWRTATGQDANSFEFVGGDVSQLFSGTYSAGDYRLAGTGSGATAASIGAGPQFHWDWNAKAKVSGPPTSWPNVPKTLADAITYGSNPAAWSW
jgi:hypothetical protein